MTDIAFGEHPIFDRHRFFIATPMMQQLQATLLQWLWCGATGGLILGDARVGKSRAIAWLAHSLQTRAGEPIPVHCMTVAARDHQTVAGVLRNLAYACGLSPNNRDTADVMANALVHFLAESSLANASRYTVLIVDEVQRLLISQLGAFAELHDKLVPMHVNLIVVFVGNERESDDLLQQIQGVKHSHIRGRFFLHRLQYTGLRTVDEVASCLGHYDDVGMPTAGSPSATAYFLPDAYAGGWRLRSLARPLWQMYREHYQRPFQLPSWGMQYFVTTVNTLLVDYLPQLGTDDDDAIDTMVLECLKVSGLEHAQAVIA